MLSCFRHAIPTADPDRQWARLMSPGTARPTGVTISHGAVPASAVARMFRSSIPVRGCIQSLPGAGWMRHAHSCGNKPGLTQSRSALPGRLSWSDPMRHPCPPQKPSAERVVGPQLQLPDSSRHNAQNSKVSFRRKLNRSASQTPNGHAVRVATQQFKRST